MKKEDKLDLAFSMIKEAIDDGDITLKHLHKFLYKKSAYHNLNYEIKEQDEQNQRDLKAWNNL